MEKLASGHEVEKLVGDELAEQQRDFADYTYDIVRLHPGRWILPMPFLQHAPDIYNLDVNIKQNKWFSFFCSFSLYIV